MAEQITRVEGGCFVERFATVRQTPTPKLAIERQGVAVITDGRLSHIYSRLLQPDQGRTYSISLR